MNTSDKLESTPINYLEVVLAAADNLGYMIDSTVAQEIIDEADNHFEGGIKKLSVEELNEFIKNHVDPDSFGEITKKDRQSNE